MDVIHDAARFAKQAHANQVRKYSGRPYIEHVARVAARVAAYGDATETMIAAAWLHDVVEDSGVTLAELASRFGADVAELVRELTNPSKGSSAPRAERKAQDRERLAGASWAAKIIKLMDRIDNLSELDDAPVEFRRLYAEESLLLAEVIGDADAELKQELIAAARKHLGHPPA